MAMFLLSMVIVTYNLASAQLEPPEDPIGALHHCFRLVQGVTLVMRPHFTQIMTSNMMGKLVEQGNGVSSEDERSDVPEILRLKKLAETKRNSAHDFYTSAIDDLHIHFLKTRQCPPENDRLVRT